MLSKLSVTATKDVVATAANMANAEFRLLSITQRKRDLALLIESQCNGSGCSENKNEPPISLINPITSEQKQTARHADVERPQSEANVNRTKSTHMNASAIKENTRKTCANNNSENKNERSVDLINPITSQQKQADSGADVELLQSEVNVNRTKSAHMNASAIKEKMTKTCAYNDAENKNEPSVNLINPITSQQNQAARHAEVELLQSEANVNRTKSADMNASAIKENTRKTCATNDDINAKLVSLKHERFSKKKNQSGAKLLVPWMNVSKDRNDMFAESESKIQRKNLVGGSIASFQKLKEDDNAQIQPPVHKLSSLLQDGRKQVKSSSAKFLHHNAESITKQSTSTCVIKLDSLQNLPLLDEYAVDNWTETW
jgi:hypothetical protein